MATQTIQIADKSTLDEVKALLENSGYGLEALKKLIGSNNSATVPVMEDIASNYSKAFSSGKAVVLNEEIHVLSIYNHYKWTGNEWVKISNTTPFTPTGVVVLNGEIHIFNEYNHYKWTGNEWISVSTLPCSFSASSGAVVLDGNIHILCTYVSSSSSTFDVHYKWNGSSWTSVSSLPYHYPGKAVVLNGEIHILKSNTEASSRYHYKWDGTAWTSVSTLPSTLFYYSAEVIVLNGEIHALCLSSSRYHYKWDGTAWTSVSLLPYTFSTLMAVVLNETIHIIGGNSVDGYTFHYKRDDTSWTKDYIYTRYLSKGTIISLPYYDDTLNYLYPVKNCEALENNKVVTTKTGYVTFNVSVDYPLISDILTFAFM